MLLAVLCINLQVRVVKVYDKSKGALPKESPRFDEAVVVRCHQDARHKLLIAEGLAGRFPLWLHLGSRSVVNFELQDD